MKTPLIRSLIVTAALTQFSLTGFAATNTWTGGGSPDGDWSNAANWGGTGIAAKDILFFDGSNQLLATNDFAAGTIFNTVSFTPGAGSFTLFGNSFVLTNAFDIGSGQTLGGGITNSSPNSQTISNAITLSVGRHFISTDGGAGQLNLNGPISRNTGSVLAFVVNGSPINVAGSGLANANGILGYGAAINNGVVFSDWAALDVNNNVVPYAAYTDFAAGLVSGTAGTNLRYTGDTGNSITANGTTVNSLLSQIITARFLTNNGVLRLGAKGGIFANSSAGAALTVLGGALTTAGSGGELNLLSVPGGITSRLTITSVITNDTGNAPVSVNVQGYMTINGANTYSGGTYIFNNGRITTSATSGNALSMGTGPVTIYPNGEVFFNTASATFTNTFDIAGVGTTENNSGITGPGAFRMSSTAVVSGKTTFHGNTRISTSATGAPGFTGQIVGDGQLELICFATASSVLLLSNSNNPANSWPGGTLINTLGTGRSVTVKLGANEQIPDGAGKGDVIINCTNAPDFAKLDLNGKSETINGLIATNANAASGQVTNGATVAATLILGGGDATANYNGSIKDSGFASNALSIVKIGNGTQSLSGVNAYVGGTTVSGGTLVFPSGSIFPANARVTVNSNATLNVSNILPLNLGTNSVTSSNGNFVVSLLSGTAGITTATLNPLGSSNFITVVSIPAISTYPAQFTVIKATNAVVGTLNFVLGGALPVSPGTPFGGYVSNNVANNSVDVVITNGPASIKWAGYDGSNLNSAWDIFTTDWKTFPGALTTYADGNFANFEDSASNTTATISVSTVSPAGITVNNSALTPYTINGFGGITGSGGLVKQGSGTLILDNSGVNDFAGDISVNAGTVQFGNNDSGGTIPTTASIIDNGSLVFARNDSIVVANPISGTGSVSENGNPNATVRLAAPNTFTGPVTVSQGTLQVGNNLALGTTNGGTTVSSGATLDLTANTINIGQELVTISGSGVNNVGALYNSSGNGTFSQANLSRLVLAADASVGAGGRIDLRSSNTGDPSLTSLSTLGAARKLTKVGFFQFGLVGATVDPQLADIEVQQGSLSIEAATTGLGNPANTLSVWGTLQGATAALQLFAPTNRLNKNFVLNDGCSISNASGNSVIIGPMSITNSSQSGNPYISFYVGGISLTLSNVITGNGIIYRPALATNLIIAGTSPNFAGGIYQNVPANTTLASSGTLSNGLGVIINVGSFTVNGTLLGAGITNSFNSSILGGGVSAGIADVNGYLFPGASNSVGTITLGGLVLESGGTLGYDLTFNNTPGGGVNDLVVINGDLIMNGGTIAINPLALLKHAPAFSYRLINYSGALVTNSIPTVTMPQNYVGTLDFSTTNQVNLLVTGGPAVWNGGSASDSLWSDAANWQGVAISPGNSLYFDGTTRLNNTNDTAASSTYQDLSFNVDAGSFSLNGNDIVLNGNIINQSTNAQTVLIPMSSSAANNIFNGGTNAPGSKLIIGGGWTNTAGSGTSNTLVGVGLWTNLLFTANTGLTNTISVTDANANWTMMDNAASAGTTNPVILDIQSGTFSFGQGSSAPTLATISTGVSRVGVATNGPAVLNMNNGTLTFAGRLNTGTALGTVATINQSGGTLDAQALLQLSDGVSNAFTTVNLSGGTLNVGTPTAQSLFLCSRGTGIFNVTISGVVRCGTFDVSRNIGPTYGKVNIDGGRMEVNRFGTATSSATGVAGAVAILNFNGGTVRARQNNGTFIQGAATCPITCMVRSGGAIIDDAGFGITILEPLQHDTNALAPATDGGLLKLGTGNLTLTAVNSYTGPTTVSNGTLTVNGALGTNTVTVATNATLAGTGTVNGLVTILGFGTLAPGTATATGTLTVSNNFTFQDNSKAFMKLSKSPTANDLLIAKNTNATTITFAGTLSVTNLAGTLVAGDSFKLFSATNLSGTFRSIQPAQPAIGLTWDTSQLYTQGILKIGSVSQPGISNVALAGGGGSINISGTNGTPGLSYRILTSSDVTLPTSSWTILGTNTFDGSGQFLFNVGTTNALQFFRVQAL
jgi:autotransporter-associated beta strand protein